MTNQELLEKFAQNTASEEDVAIFWGRLQALAPEDAAELIEQYERILGEVKDYGPVDQRLLLEMQQRVAGWETKKKVYPLRRYWAAASIVFVLCMGTYLWFQHNREQKGTDTYTQLSSDIKPGKAGAILTLADGTQLVLDSLGNGVVATQNGAAAVLKNGQLSYERSGKDQGEVVYNTMSTPRGRQFHVTLPDATVVWLNAASSIRFPTVFKGAERRVEVVGEAYFEVAKNEKIPFRVSVNGRAEIEVLGTHFNVDAYDNNKALKTTLLEGSVKVNGTVIKPGEQALITNALRVIKNADLSKVMAWKNGLFNFEGATLEEVMQQLERWYDIEVVYEKGIPDIAFGGEMTKNISLDGLLLALEKSDIHFRLEGRKLIVLP